VKVRDAAAKPLARAGFTEGFWQQSFREAGAKKIAGLMHQVEVTIG
jgi:hypothetical protein